MRPNFRDQQIADQYSGSVMSCRSCKAMTEHQTLCNLGGMCRACFEHYQDPDPKDYPPLTLEEKRGLLAAVQDLMRPPGDPGRACADALRARLERNGRLEAAQRLQLAALEAIGK